jgi:hypothetical protein
VRQTFIGGARGGCSKLEDQRTPIVIVSSSLGTTSPVSWSSTLVCHGEHHEVLRLDANDQPIRPVPRQLSERKPAKLLVLKWRQPSTPRDVLGAFEDGGDETSGKTFLSALVPGCCFVQLRERFVMEDNRLHRSG